MGSRGASALDINEYVSRYPEDVQKILTRLRKTIHKAVPGLEEKISYQIPAFTLEGRYVVYLAAFKNHVSLYPAPRGDEEFAKELSAFSGGKGTVQFPLDQPIPLDLVRRIVKFLANRAQNRSAARPKAR